MYGVALCVRDASRSVPWEGHGPADAWLANCAGHVDDLESSAECVDAVALGAAVQGEREVVQRMALVGHLEGPVGALDHAEQRAFGHHQGHRSALGEHWRP